MHAVNFIIFLGSMAAFEIFLNELCGSRVESVDGIDAAGPLPIWALQGTGYSLCLYAGLIWISISNVTPDQIVVIVMYLVAALLLRMRGELAGFGICAAFGILLGIGYLTKAALLPLGIVSLGATLFLTPRADLGARIARTLVAAMFFALVGAPLVIARNRRGD